MACCAEFKYPAYDSNDRNLEIQLQPYLKYSTEQLEDQLLAIIKAGIPTQAEISGDPQAVELFKDRLEKAERALRAYHYRPIPKAKTFKARSQAFEKSIQIWLAQAQKELEPLHPVQKDTMRKQRVMEEIPAVVQRVAENLEEYRKRKKILPYMIKDIQAGIDRFNNLQKEYRTFVGRPFDDQMIIAQAQKWIDQQKN